MTGYEICYHCKEKFWVNSLLYPRDVSHLHQGDFIWVCESCFQLHYFVCDCSNIIFRKDVNLELGLCEWCAQDSGKCGLCDAVVDESILTLTNGFVYDDPFSPPTNNESLLCDMCYDDWIARKIYYSIEDYSYYNFDLNPLASVDAFFQMYFSSIYGEKIKKVLDLISAIFIRLERNFALQFDSYSMPSIKNILYNSSHSMFKVSLFFNNNFILNTLKKYLIKLTPEDINQIKWFIDLIKQIK